MKILYVVHQFFPYHHTGTERLTLQLAKQMQKMGNYVTVLTYEPNKSNEGFVSLDKYIMKKEYQFETIPVIALKAQHSLQDRDFHIFEDQISKHIPEILNKFDIVHFTHPMRLGATIKVCKELKVPTVLTLTDNWLLCPHGLLTKNLELCDGPEEGKKCMHVCKYDKKILSRYQDAKSFFDSVDMIFAGCEFLKESFGLNHWNKKINLNTFSMDYSYVKPKEEIQDRIITFGFIGSLIWQKGVHILIDAFKKIPEENVRLKIYGKGVEGDMTENNLVSLASNDKRIEFCGTFEYEELPNIINKLSIVVIPSTYKEIYPLVMQIARAYKKPIIASKIGGMPEVIENGVNGYLFDIGNSDQLASIMDSILKNPEILSQLKKGITLPPGIEEEAFNYAQAYEQLLKNKN